MNTNILSIDEVEVTASDIPLLYNHRTSVIESAVKKGSFFYPIQGAVFSLNMIL